MISRLVLRRVLFGLAGVIGVVLPGAASALSYRLVKSEFPNCRGQCPAIIVATGTIGEAEHLNFADFVSGLGEGAKISQTMVIDSNGGFVTGGAMLGFLLRKIKMTVIVGQSTGETMTPSSGLTSGTCASACVLVLAGGKSRFFVPGSRVGVHRSHTGGTVLDPTTRRPVNGTVNYEDSKAAHIQYFKQMGVGQGLVTLLDKTPSATIYWLSPAEMAKFRLAQDVRKNR